MGMMSRSSIQVIAILKGVFVTVPALAVVGRVKIGPIKTLGTRVVVLGIAS